MTERMATRGPRAGNTFLGCTRFPVCRGNLPADGLSPPKGRGGRTSPGRKKAAPPKGAPNPARQSLNIGDLLVSSANKLGVGKAVARHGNILVLEYFDNPGQDPSDRYRDEVPITGLRRFRLDQEVRAFWEKDQLWRSGRLEEINEHRDISVRYRDKTIFVNERDVFIRWDRPLTDPIGFGEVGLMESPYLSDLRRPFMRHILQQRSAAHGMGAALSSSIQLHSHQLDAARRVLEDPIQRYLLADEVGLGKTIEAGIVIRQILQDRQQSTVSLILPPFLLNQWQRELESKFGIGDFSRGRIKFARDDRPEDWLPADLLVVDEAHNLARLRISRNPRLRQRYEKLTEVALKSPSLLLLSATPVLHNEEIYLGMLQILDPALYGKATANELREKISVRADLGRSLLGLKTSLPKSVIIRRLEDLRGLLAKDEHVEHLVRAVESAADAPEKEGLSSAIEELQSYVSDIYRVHRRMIRTRRTEGLKSGYAVQGRSVPSALQLDSDILRTLSDLLEEWRQCALASVEVGDLDAAVGAKLLSEACALILDPTALASWAQLRRDSAVSKDEVDVLERIQDYACEFDRVEIISRPIADLISYEVSANERVVVFCPTADLAEELGRAIGDLLGEDVVGMHLDSSEPSAAEEVVRTFDGNSSRNRILVCDNSAEEGRNFQLADVVVHVGLPSDVNQLEQRIGRCDRWTGDADSTPARSYLATSGASVDEWDVLWFTIIRDGFEIFSNSVASLQHAVELANQLAWQTLLTTGSGATSGLEQLIRDQLLTELERVREQDALDSREARTDTRSIFAHVTVSESEEAEFALTADNLFARDGVPGNLKLKRVGSPRVGEGHYSITPDKRAEPPLIPLWRVRRDFVQLEGQAATFKREIAVARPQVRLYRYGAPFIEAISDFVWHDDRGRCFGMWRYDPDWKEEEFVGYRFDIHVDADVSQALSLTSVMDDSDQYLAIQRRADSLFPPAVETVWVAPDQSVISDTGLLSPLERRYQKPRNSGDAGDFNLNTSRLQQVYELLPQNKWGPMWRAAEATARSAITTLQSLTNRIERSLELCGQDAVERQRQLALRESHSQGMEASALHAESVLERAISEQLQSAVKTPRLSLDSTGIVILAGQMLESDAG